MLRPIFVVGAKGGVGATTVASEIATRICTRRPCAIVDADLNGHRSHAILTDAADALDANRAHGEPGVAKIGTQTILEFTRTFEDSYHLTSDMVEVALERLPADITCVVDAPQPLAAAVRPLTSKAVRFVVVTEPTLLGVNGARLTIANLLRARVPRDRIVVVTNTRNASGQLRRGEIESALGMSVGIELPQRSDRHYGRSIANLVAQLDEVPVLEPLCLAPPVFGTAVARTNTNSTKAAHLLESIGSRLAIRSASEHSSEGHDQDRYDAIKSELTSAIMGRIDFVAAARLRTDDEKMAEFRLQVDELASELIAERTDIDSAEEALLLKREIIDEALGFGPLESLLADPSVTEIMVNGASNVYVERNGKLEKTGKRFVRDDQVRLVIDRIIAPLGRRIDESSPMVDARMADGSRVNAVISPLAIDGSILTIRRFGTHRLTTNDLVRLGSMNATIAAFLDAAVKARLNIVISGGTGSGKTTLLGAVSSYIPKAERIVTIEDAAELSLDQPHVVRLESRPSNLEGKGEVAIRDLVRNALRMRPDRIVVGECRSGETLDMLQAMNTGHDGSLTTVHANSARDALYRIETMVLMAGFDLPVRAIREQVSAAIDIIIQVSRMRDGSRRIVSLCEVAGMEGDTITMQEIVRYRQRGMNEDGRIVGDFEATGVQPRSLSRFAEMGIEFDASLLSSPTHPFALQVRA